MREPQVGSQLFAIESTELDQTSGHARERLKLRSLQKKTDSSLVSKMPLTLHHERVGCALTVQKQHRASKGYSCTDQYCSRARGLALAVAHDSYTRRRWHPGTHVLAYW